MLLPASAATATAPVELKLSPKRNTGVMLTKYIVY
jgi:hypothetical protein